ncbi:TraX family protein [Shimazuella soli]|uniref:TraX family protein n=1 Tax=Shimazuella soli TaxID=1892854 RepID=UPI003B836C0B
MTVFILKIIALVAMLMDNLEGSFPDTFPVVFGWIGRISIPVFMFCIVQGLIHTRSRKKYLVRIYIGSVVMAVGSCILQAFFPDAKFQIADNIFATFFLMGVLITLATVRLTRYKKVALWIGFFLIQIISFLLITKIRIISNSYAYLVSGFIPNIVTAQGSALFVLQGILIYAFSNDHVKFTVMYILFCLLMFVNPCLSGFTVQNLFYGNYQWIMIIALPLMLSYNGKRGKSLKYFFYAFYPLHIWILFVIANIIQIKK